ncbi:glycosyltransferase family 9 protein [Bacteroides sp. 51]|uniref:glycosyltransferase family 9 protein n=1 Tax=Bacteroides sp. 51 TaxID=2302938 RepID=UPI0013D61430|nr:glycosyltransferase family 9 protein [Bacteroides sp. 51]NDV80462.1 glycosyltransferase family 9 protein [Bacteroides sp. 51]
MAKILVIRFSAIGDVAMTIPVIYSLARQYPQDEITVLSSARLGPLFQKLPANVSFVGADLKGENEGLGGLRRLYRLLKAMDFDYVADFHGVLRSKYLSLRLLFSVVKTATIHKGRKGKSKLVRRHNKVMVAQKSSFQRYADVLARIGFPVSLEFTSIYDSGKGDFTEIASIVGLKEDQKWIGIAPFAKHKGKIYPVELQEQVVAHFSTQPGVKVFLFGGGKYEQEVFDSWIAKYPSVVSMIGKLDIGMELNLISHLDVMLSMDSANMHLASLVNTPVVSIWGATHPYAGFMGWKQLPSNTIQLDLACRPCSVFGQEPCWRKDYACLWGITPKQVISKIEQVLNAEKQID